VEGTRLYWDLLTSGRKVPASLSLYFDFVVTLVTLQMHMPVRISRTLNLNLHEEDAKQEVVVVAGQFVRDMAPGQSPSSLLPQQERPVRMGAAGIASPKRAVSLSRDGASVSLLAKGEREPVVSVPKQGAKPTEVYGFVGAISTLVAFGTSFLSLLENLCIVFSQPFLFPWSIFILFVF
jgi:hypothetical protein